MRKLLQSNLGVGLLCAVAALCIAANFVKLPAPRTLTASARSLNAPSPVSAPESFHVPPPLQIAPALSSWRELFPSPQLTRDPFALVLERPSNLSGPSSAGAPAIPNFVLQAVSIDGDRALAVVNRRVLAVGESIGDYQVERIEPSQVCLKSRWGSVVVPFARSASHGKSASASTPAADPSKVSGLRSLNGSGR